MAKSPKNAAAVEGENVETVANENDAVSTESKAKRTPKASVTYVMADGSEKNFPNKDATTVRIETTGGTKRDYDVSKLGENTRACAILQGVAIRFQRGYQALKAEDEILASIDETVSDLDNDIWIEVGTGEPRVTNLVTAIVMAIEAKGETVDAARRQGIIDKLSADENMRKEMRERPVIAANLAQLASEAAQKRAAEKLKKASESTEDATSGF